MSTYIYSFEELYNWIDKNTKTLLVCGNSSKLIQELNKVITQLKDKLVLFNDFSPNPDYESIKNGVKVFRNEECDSIMAVGGGSAIDVAKCIKAFSDKTGDGADGAWLESSSLIKDIPFLAMPTTAGSGSEETMFAVFYYSGEKQSISNFNLIPKTIFLCPEVLSTLPDYQKKATLSDALCHSIESFWSINSNDQSKKLSKEAIKLILENYVNYLSGDKDASKIIMNASNLAGKAINITKTTAGHAMCYKITTLFGCAHGHSALMCNKVLYPWMIENINRCTDPRGVEYLRDVFCELAHIFGFVDLNSSKNFLLDFYSALKFDTPFPDEDIYNELVRGVNVERLNNNPIKLDDSDIFDIYHKILGR